MADIMEVYDLACDLGNLENDTILEIILRIQHKDLLIDSIITEERKTSTERTFSISNSAYTFTLSIEKLDFIGKYNEVALWVNEYTIRSRNDVKGFKPEIIITYVNPYWTKTVINELKEPLMYQRVIEFFDNQAVTR